MEVSLLEFKTGRLIDGNREEEGGREEERGRITKGLKWDRETERMGKKR